MRGDRGGENVGIAMFKLEHPYRGVGRSSFISGKSISVLRGYGEMYSKIASFYITDGSITWKMNKFLIMNTTFGVCSMCS